MGIFDELYGSSIDPNSPGPDWIRSGAWWINRVTKERRPVEGAAASYGVEDPEPGMASPLKHAALKSAKAAFVDLPRDLAASAVDFPGYLAKGHEYLTKDVPRALFPETVAKADKGKEKIADLFKMTDTARDLYVGKKRVSGLLEDVSSSIESKDSTMTPWVRDAVRSTGTTLGLMGTAALGPAGMAASAGAIFAGEAGGATESERDLGAEHGTATLIGTGVGAVNAALERVGMTHLLRAFGKAPNITASALIKRQIKSVLATEPLTESLQSVSSDVGNIAAVRSIGGDTSKIKAGIIDRALDAYKSALIAGPIMGKLGGAVQHRRMLETQDMLEHADKELEKARKTDSKIDDYLKKIEGENTDIEPLPAGERVRRMLNKLKAEGVDRQRPLIDIAALADKGKQKGKGKFQKSMEEGIARIRGLTGISESPLTSGTFRMDEDGNRVKTGESLSDIFGDFKNTEDRRFIDTRVLGKAEHHVELGNRLYGEDNAIDTIINNPDIEAKMLSPDIAEQEHATGSDLSWIDFRELQKAGSIDAYVDNLAEAWKGTDSEQSLKYDAKRKIRTVLTKVPKQALMKNVGFTQFDDDITNDSRAAILDLREKYKGTDFDIDDKLKRYRVWMTKATIDPLIEIGFLTLADKERMMEKNQEYIPFFRLQKVMEEFDDSKLGRGALTPSMKMIHGGLSEKHKTTPFTFEESVPRVAPALRDLAGRFITFKNRLSCLKVKGLRAFMTSWLAE